MENIKINLRKGVKQPRKATKMQYIHKVIQTKVKTNKAYFACVLEIKDNINLNTIKSLDDKNINRVLWTSKPTTYKSLAPRSEYRVNAFKAKWLCKYYNEVASDGGMTAESALLLYGRHMPQTREKVKELSERGFLFFPGNNPTMGETKKWVNYGLVRVAQVNSKTHGYSKKTLWAVHPFPSSMTMDELDFFEEPENQKKYRIDRAYEKVYIWNEEKHAYIYLTNFQDIGVNRGTKDLLIAKKAEQAYGN